MPFNPEELQRELRVLGEETLISGEYTYEPNDNKDIERALSHEPPYLHTEIGTVTTPKAIIIDNWKIFEELFSEELYAWTKSEKLLHLMLWFQQYNYPIYFCDGKKLIPLGKLDAGSGFPLQLLAQQATPTPPEEIYKLAEKIGLARNKIAIADQHFFQVLKNKKVLSFSVLMALDDVSFIRALEENSHIEELELGYYFWKPPSPKQAERFKKCLERLPHLKTLIVLKMQQLKFLPTLKNSITSIRTILDSADNITNNVDFEKFPQVRTINTTDSSLTLDSSKQVINRETRREQQARPNQMIQDLNSNITSIGYVSFKSSMNLAKYQFAERLCIMRNQNDQTVEFNEAALPTLTHLHELRLSNAPVRFSAQMIAHAPNLTKLIMDNCDLSSLKDLKMSPNTHLRTLELNNCTISEELLRQLPILFPNVENIIINKIKVIENPSLHNPIQLSFNKLRSFDYTVQTSMTEKLSFGLSTLITPSLMELKMVGETNFDFQALMQQGVFKNLRNVEFINVDIAHDTFCELANYFPEDLAKLILRSNDIQYTETLYNAVTRFRNLRNLNLFCVKSSFFEKFKEKFPEDLISVSTLPPDQEIKEPRAASSTTTVQQPFTADGQPSVGEMTLDAKTQNSNTIFRTPILFKTKDPSLDITNLYRLKVSNRLSEAAKPYREAKWMEYKEYTVCQDIATEFERSPAKDIAYSAVEIPSHTPGKQVLASLSPNEKITHIQIISDDPRPDVKIFYDKATRTYAVEVRSDAPVQIKYMFKVNRQAYDDKYAPNDKFRQIIAKYKAFEHGESKINAALTGRALLDAIQNQPEKPFKGTCLHRSYGCFDELLKLGYDVNLTGSGCHLFVEWQHPEGKVYTIDLGGAPGLGQEVLPYNEDKRIRAIPQEDSVAPPPTLDEKQYKKYEAKPIILSAESPKTFFDGLFAQSRAPLLLMLPTPEHIQGLSNAATDYLAELSVKKPYHFVDDLDELRKQAFQKFLEAASTSEEITLFVRWDKNKPLKPQHVGLNSLFEKTPTLDGVTLPKNLRIVALMDKTTRISEDVRSRFTASRMITVPPELNLPLGENLKPAKASEEAKASTNVMLYDGIDWEKTLLGQDVFINGVAEFKPGALFNLIAGNEEKAGTRSLTVINPPWHLPQFKVFWNKLCKERQFFSKKHGKFISLAEGVQLNWKSQPYPDRTGIPKESLNKQNHQEWKCVLNQATRARFFYQLACKDKKPNQAPGYLKQYANKPLSILVTEEMTDGQWEELFDKADEYKCTLKPIFAQNVKIPERFGKKLPPAVSFKRKNSPVQLITTNDVQFHIEENLRGKQVLTVSDNSQYGLVEDWFTTPDGGEMNREGILLQLLRQGDVVLKGDFSPKLLKRLQTLFSHPPYLEFNGERLEFGADKPLKGNLYIISEKNPFSFVKPTLQREITVEDYWKLVPQKELGLIKRLCAAFDIKIQYYSQITAILQNLKTQPEKNPMEWLLLLKKNPEEILRTSDEVYRQIRAECDLSLPEQKDSKTEEKDELAQRIHKIVGRLDTLPFLFLIGPSGTGKTTTVLQELPAHYKKQGKETRLFVTTPPLLENISPWAKARDDKMKILFIDEANLEKKDLYSFVEGLLKNPKEIVYNGERIELTDNHKIIFAGNYQHYEKRYLHALFLKYDCVAHWPRFSPDFELSYQVYPAIVAAFQTGESKLPEIQDNAKQVMKIFSDALLQAQALIGTEKITVRNLQAMSLAFGALWKNKALEKIAGDPNIRSELFAKWVFYQNARDVMGAKAEILKSQLFGSVANYDQLKKAFPRIRREKRGEIYVTASHKRSLAVLEEELAIRQLRCQTPTTLGLSCGTRGTLIEGAPGIGKSSVVINHLEQLGFIKAIPGREYNIQTNDAPKLYYHITPMEPEKMKKILIDAFHQGAVVVIDELNSLPLEGLINSLMMGIDPNGNFAKREGFYVVATQNPISLDNREALSTATENRFRKIHMPNFSEPSLRKFLKEEHRWATDDVINHFAKKYLQGVMQLPPYNFRELLSDMAFAKTVYESQQLIQSKAPTAQEADQKGLVNTGGPSIS